VSDELVKNEDETDDDREPCGYLYHEERAVLATFVRFEQGTFTP